MLPGVWERQGRRGIRILTGDKKSTGGQGATPFDDSGPTGPVWTDRGWGGFCPRACDLPRFRRVHADPSDRNGRLDAAGRGRSRRYRPDRAYYDRTHAASGGAPGGARRGAPAQPVCRAVFAGRRDSGDRHRGRRDSVGRMGDQPPFHERRGRFHQRVEPGDAALSRIPVPGAAARRPTDGGRHRSQRAAAALRSYPVQGLFQLARKDARLRRSGFDEERRQSA